MKNTIKPSQDKTVEKEEECACICHEGEYPQDCVATCDGCYLTKDEYCEKSMRVDGKKHSLRFDGDDPYTICVYCGERRDVISGKII